MVPGTYVGAGGCGPCIGMIYETEDHIYTFHFSMGSDPEQALHEVLGSNAPAGGVLLFGGDNGWGSNGTLEDVLDYLDHQSDATIIGYASVPSLFIDQSGNIYTTAPPGYPQNSNDPDELSPPLLYQLGSQVIDIVIDDLNTAADALLWVLYPD